MTADSMNTTQLKKLGKEPSSKATELGIRSNIVACVTDSAASKKKAVTVLHWNRLRCFTHVLNLIVRNGIQLPQVQIIRKVKSIKDDIRGRTVASAKLREFQLQMGQRQVRLKHDIGTRWNSTYMTNRCTIEVKEPLISTIILVNPQLPAVSLQELDIITESYEVQQPFEVTVELSSEMCLTILLLYARNIIFMRCTLVILYTL